MSNDDAESIRRYKLKELGDDWHLEQTYGLIPFIADKPHPEAFDITKNTPELIKYLDQRDELKSKHKRVLVISLVIFSVFWLILVIPYGSKDMGGTANGLLGGFLTALIIVWPLIAGINALMTPASFRRAKKKHEPYGAITEYSDPRQKYRQYKEQLSMYEYWEKRRSLAFWALLDEREMNRSLEQIYRKHGYRVKTEHLFYGQRRELCIEKGGKKSVVYCAKSGKEIDEGIINRLTNDKEFNHVIIVTFTSLPDGITKLAKQKNVEVLGWQKILSLI